ncbi:MAG TPA: EthD domain-containing protein [Myxococcaceae bacterium]|nr:EthD domain-containing protein [Myxococcaceae bacterium]
MVKLVYILRARSDLAPGEFNRYWLTEHAPKVREVAKAVRARKYVQSHTLNTPLNEALVSSRGMSPFYEGITEVYWDSLEELQAAIATPEGAAALKMLAEDERKFIDLARSTVFMTQEHEIFDFTR